MGVIFASLFYYVVLGVLSSLAIILLRKREVDVILQLCCGCLCSMSLPHCTIGWSAIYFVVYPGQTHLSDTRRSP